MASFSFFRIKITNLNENVAYIVIFTNFKSGMLDSVFKDLQFTLRDKSFICPDLSWSAQKLQFYVNPCLKI